MGNLLAGQKTNLGGEAVKYRYLVPMLLACAPVAAEVPPEEWVWQSLHLIDTMQTIRIAQHPETLEESNPILGRHPSVGSVVAWSAATSVLHYVVADQLDKHGFNPRWFEYFTIGIKANVVYMNWRYKVGP